MKHDAPTKIKPAEMGLKGCAIRGVDAIGQRRDIDCAGTIDDKTAHRDARVAENGDGWIEMNLETGGLHGRPDQTVPGRLPITKTDFVQALTDSLDDGGRQDSI
ncbi:hypothetical protein GCM10023213_44380 [Prosthecobacter algae]|uniref:Uncharacterized protein n=1 Tax=Prosthecobacter algae TaxID=1144682 RepID=A0ABP9PL08_9BACT